MVSVLAFYSNDLSSNLAEGYNFSVDIVVEKNENKQKEAVIGTLKKQVEPVITKEGKDLESCIINRYLGGQSRSSFRLLRLLHRQGTVDPRRPLDPPLG